MASFLIVLSLFICGLFSPVAAIAKSPSQMAADRLGQPSLLISLGDFEALAGELATKVNLFRDVWQKEPTAEFFGGTSRDYLYWLKGKLAVARTPAELQDIIAHLRSQPVIDVREFILYESDIDLISKRSVDIKSKQYGVKKIDAISAERLDPTTQAGQDELKQGFIPAEKIRLGRDGIKKSPQFGDGAAEIFNGKTTVHFASKKDFSMTEFAKTKLNHPVLLALRYIRILAMDYYQIYGREYPDPHILLGSIDPQSEEAVRRVIESSLSSTDLQKYLKNDRFKFWMNSAIQKAFRSYTNPTAAKILMEYFGADRLMLTYNGLEPINQYLFRKHRVRSIIMKNFEKFSIDRPRLFSPMKDFFPDGKFYHGTKTERAFRSIIFQGVLPSESGAAGQGLYGVGFRNLPYAQAWGGDPNRVVVFDLDPRAKIVDITKGYGKRALQMYLQSVGGATLEDFAEAFGIDIIRYEYPTTAFVVKNGGVLKEVNGHKRQLMKIGEMLRWARNLKKIELKDLLTTIIDNGLSKPEVELLSTVPLVKKELDSLDERDGREVVNSLLVNGGLDPDRSVLDVPQVEAAFVRALHTLTTQQLSDPNDILNIAVFGKEKQTEIDHKAKRNIREIFVQTIPSIFSGKSTQEVEEIFLEANKGQSWLGFFGCMYEVLRRSGNLEGADKIKNEVIDFRADIAQDYYDGIHDAIANFNNEHQFTIQTWRKWVLQETDKMYPGRYILEQMWEKFGFDVKGNAEFIEEMAHKGRGLELMLYSLSHISEELGRKKRMVFPKRWTVLDKVVEKHLYSLGKKGLKPDFDTGFYIYPWLNRALEVAPERVRPEALIAAYDLVGRPKPLNNENWIHRYEIHEAVSQFPQLRLHPRGAAIFEETLSHPNFVNTDDMDNRLLRLINTTWADHPRAPLWRKALKLERENRFDEAGVVTREDFLRSSGAKFCRDLLVMP